MEVFHALMEGVAINVVLQRIKRKIWLMYRTGQALVNYRQSLFCRFHGRLLGFFRYQLESNGHTIRRLYTRKGNAIYRTVTKLVDVSTLNEEGTGKRRHTDRRLANCGALVSVIL